MLISLRGVVVFGLVPVDEVDVFVAVLAAGVVFQLVASGEKHVEGHVALVQCHAGGVAGTETPRR